MTEPPSSRLATLRRSVTAARRFCEASLTSIFSSAPIIPTVKRRRRWFWPAALLLCLAVAGAAGGWLWNQRRAPMPVPPTIDLEGCDPEVVAAIERARQQVLQSPRSAIAWGRLGGLLTAFYYRHEALACLAQAERLDPKEPRWPYHQGVLLLTERSDDALPYLRRAVELCGDKTLAPRLRLSETLRSLGQLDEAEEGFRQVRQRDPRNARAALGLGRIAKEREDWRQARSYLEAAAADRLCMREATLDLVKLYQQLGDNEREAQLYVRLERLPADPPWPDPYVDEIRNCPIGKRFRLRQTDRLIEQGHFQEAIAQLHQLTVDYPNAADVWFSLGQTLHRCGAYPQAEQALAKVVEMTPGCAEAHNLLGAARLRQGKLAQAETSLRKAIELKCDFALAYSNLGRCLLQKKDTAGALDSFGAAVRCKPDYAALHTERAELLHQTQQDAEALEEVCQALQLNPDDERAKQLRDQLKSEPRP
ncbi:MAG: tetratricopeptide repeat protein [Gemmataceae bacterium]